MGIESGTMSSFEKWLTMALLCLSGSIIFWLPYFSEIFYVPMQEAFGFSHAQMGALMTVFGTVSFLGYFPGGWLADYYSPRKLITTGLVITSTGGFVFSTIPSFTVTIVIYGVWGLSGAFIFWAAMIKATRNWAAEDEQGKAFGALEGGRNIVDLASTSCLLAIFAFRGGDGAALNDPILALSAACLLLAVLVWNVMRDVTPEHDASQERRPIIEIEKLKAVLRLPIIWLIGLIIMTAYCGLWGSIYFTPYATDIYELGNVGGGVVGMVKYAIAFVVAISAGLVADKFGTARVIAWFFAIMTGGYVIFALVPGGPGLLLLLIVNGVLITAAVFALRGTYYSLLEQGGVPIAMTGTAVGVISVMAYSPTIYLPVLVGMILDANPGALGYQYLYMVIAGINFIGLGAAIVVYRKIQFSPAVSAT